MIFAAASAAACLTIAAAFHFYWAIGGSAGKAGAIPSKNGVPLLHPSNASTATVGIVLGLMAIFALVSAGVWPLEIPRIYLQIGCVGLALLFLARAIGEFRYVGFFKRDTASLFASRDTMFYSPICLILSLLFAILASKPG